MTKSTPCPKCGYEPPMDLFVFKNQNSGLNFCPECGKRLREVPHLEMPPDWGKFSITICGMASSIIHNGTARCGLWRFEATGPSYRLEDMLKAKWGEECDKRRRRNIEIDEINKGE